MHHALVAGHGDGELGVQMPGARVAHAAGRLGDGAGELGGPQVGPEAAADGVDVAGDGVGANVVLPEAVNILLGARRARDRGGEAREGGKGGEGEGGKHCGD